MPTYVYETIPQDPTEQPKRFELFQSMMDDELTVDPNSGLPVRRIITGGLGFQLNGRPKDSSSVETPAPAPTSTSSSTPSSYAGHSFDCECC